MALINCSECGSPISDTAKFCPKCGHRKNNNNNIIILVPIIIISLVAMICIGVVIDEQNRQREIEEDRERLNEALEDYAKTDKEIKCLEEIGRKMDENGNINYYSVSKECRYLVDKFAE